jgi:iron complex outermembrane recepter protein
MKIAHLCFFLFLSIIAQAQTAGIKGQLMDAGGDPVVYANVAAYNAADSLLQKVETTDESGQFHIRGLQAGSYFLTATFLGMADLRKDGISIKDGQTLELGSLDFQAAAVELATATVTNSRAMVEVKPDRTVFNVDGTINSVGSDALTLLRKAPSVTVDNNDNINVLGRAGVLLYVDGKRLPLTGQDLSNYLQNLPADQIDRFDIITNPGAKYEAQGNAGIIDIRLKRDKNMGANGSVSISPNQGRYGRINTSATGNYRNKKMNAFANAGAGTGGGFSDMKFRSLQNGLLLNETHETVNDWRNINLRIGADFFLSKNHTLGFLASANRGDRASNSLNRIGISRQSTPALVDSLLVAKTVGDNGNRQNTYNLNYRFDNAKGRSLNLDLDYGDYGNTSVRLQPNQYFNAGEDVLLTEIVNSFDTPTDIKIYTAKADYEDDLLGGKLGFGAKYSKVVSDNTFCFLMWPTGRACATTACRTNLNTMKTYMPPM